MSSAVKVTSGCRLVPSGHPKPRPVDGKLEFWRELLRWWRVQDKLGLILSLRLQVLGSVFG